MLVRVCARGVQGEYKFSSHEHPLTSGRPSHAEAPCRLCRSFNSYGMYECRTCYAFRLCTECAKRGGHRTVGGANYVEGVVLREPVTMPALHPCALRCSGHVEASHRDAGGDGQSCFKCGTQAPTARWECKSDSCKAVARRLREQRAADGHPIDEPEWAKQDANWWCCLACMDEEYVRSSVPSSPRKLLFPPRPPSPTRRDPSHGVGRAGIRNRMFAMPIAIAARPRRRPPPAPR